MIKHNLPKGNKVIGSLELPKVEGMRQRYLILVERKNEQSPYVVARYERGATEWDTGVYISERRKAFLYFAERCAE